MRAERLGRGRVGAGHTCVVQIISSEQHRVLAFVATCNRNHYQPSQEEVEGWLASPQPNEARYETHVVEAKTTALGRSFVTENLTKPYENLFKGFMDNYRKQLAGINADLLGAAARSFEQANRRADATVRVKVADAETPVEHGVRLGWIRESDSRSLRITALGEALLQSAERADDEDTSLDVVVLGRDDALAYPMLVAHLAAAGPGLFIDPYLRIEQVHQLVQTTQLTRLIVRGHRDFGPQRAAIAVYLDSGSLARPVEVRCADGLHDRVLIADSGEVSTIGTSMNRVGRVTTVITPLPAVAAAALRSEYERRRDRSNASRPHCRWPGRRVRRRDRESTRFGVAGSRLAARPAAKRGHAPLAERSEALDPIEPNRQTLREGLGTARLDSGSRLWV